MRKARCAPPGWCGPRCGGLPGARRRGSVRVPPGGGRGAPPPGARRWSPPRGRRRPPPPCVGGAGGGPALLIATGAAPLTRSALRRLRGRGVACVNYATDDPWNKAMRAPWHLRALPEYDTVFTPRSANLNCFREIGCAAVHYLPFGYD